MNLDCLVSDGIGSKISMTYMGIGVVQIYGFISNLPSTTSIELGISKLKPVTPYIIIPFYNHSQPYNIIGTLWIKNSGESIIYKPSNVIQGYIAGVFFAK